MKKNMKVMDVISLYNGIKGIIDDSSMNVDVTFKFKLLGIMKMLEPHQQNFELLRIEKVKEYGSQTEEGFSISGDDKDAMNKFSEDMKKIMSINVEIELENLTPTEVFSSGVKSDYLVKLLPIISQA